MRMKNERSLDYEKGQAASLRLCSGIACISKGYISGHGNNSAHGANQQRSVTYPDTSQAGAHPGGGGGRGARPRPLGPENTIFSGFLPFKLRDLHF